MMVWRLLATYSGFGVELIVLAVILLAAERRVNKRIGFTLVAFFLFRLMGEMIKLGMGWSRPCWDPARPSLIECPGSFSFPSGHALGAMMVAVIVGLIFNRRIIWTAGVIIALLIAVSRIMVGVHGWLDVIVGGLLGGVFGWVTWKGYWR